MWTGVRSNSCQEFSEWSDFDNEMIRWLFILILPQRPFSVCSWILFSVRQHPFPSIYYNGTICHMSLMWNLSRLEQLVSFPLLPTFISALWVETLLESVPTAQIWSRPALSVCFEVDRSICRDKIRWFLGTLINSKTIKKKSLLGNLWKTKACNQAWFSSTEVAQEVGVAKLLICLRMNSISVSFSAIDVNAACTRA